MAIPGAGTLNKRITVESLEVGKDSKGGMVDAWTALPGMPVWAGIKNLSGNERAITSSGGDTKEARSEFTMRYRADVTEQCRIVYKGKFFNIKHLNNFNEENRMLILTCDTGSNDGR